MFARKLALILVCGLSFMLVACASDDLSDEPGPEAPAEELFSDANEALDNGNYKTAIRLFEEVERQHPYASQARESSLMAAYAAYKEQEYDRAIVSLDRFIELHPGYERIDYAYYLRALAHYEQISDVGRDQAMTVEALKSLSTLIRRFPESEYAKEAALKRDLALDHLAGKEMEIGRFYLQQNQINAALNRFRNVIEEYQTTTHVPEALHRLVESYLTLGLQAEAARVAAVLGHNYPGSEWYERSYNLLDPKARERLNESQSWVDKTVDTLFSGE